MGTQSVSGCPRSLWLTLTLLLSQDDAHADDQDGDALAPQLEFKPLCVCHPLRDPEAAGALHTVRGDAAAASAHARAVCRDGEVAARVLRLRHRKQKEVRAALPHAAHQVPRTACTRARRWSSTWWSVGRRCRPSSTSRTRSPRATRCRASSTRCTRSTSSGRSSVSFFTLRAFLSVCCQLAVINNASSTTTLTPRTWSRAGLRRRCPMPARWAQPATRFVDFCFDGLVVGLVRGHQIAVLVVVHMYFVSFRC